jgi:predicted transcriptional regulator
MMMREKAVVHTLSNTEIRRLMLQFFYDRNRSATSLMGKKGSAMTMSDVKAERKAKHGLTQQEVQSNLTYLLSQGWVEETQVRKEFQSKGGSVIPSITRHYLVTAAGIDKIEGPGEFTMPKFHDIKIEATGQNIITLGDGNQVDAQFGDVGAALAELRKAITNSDAEERDKLAFVADIDTIQSQLAKPTPNRSIIAAAWETVKAAASTNGCAILVQKVAGLIAGFLS